jgi:hypothetical protein
MTSTDMTLKIIDNDKTRSFIFLSQDEKMVYFNLIFCSTLNSI